MKKEEKYQEKISELETKVAELTAGWQRTQADFLNYKKQTFDEKAALIKSANKDLIYDLLPVLDNFQLATKHLPENLVDDNWVQGIRQIEKQFEIILSDSGLEKIESVGQFFNPELHEAIEEVSSDQESGIVIEEVLAGYQFNNSVLRPAKVKVAK